MLSHPQSAVTNDPNRVLVTVSHRTTYWQWRTSDGIHYGYHCPVTGESKMYINQAQEREVTTTPPSGGYELVAAYVGSQNSNLCWKLYQGDQS